LLVLLSRRADGDPASLAVARPSAAEFAMRGEVVAPDQDAQERERIAKASRWPAP
jgi:hypothetical protein